VTPFAPPRPTPTVGSQATTAAGFRDTSQDAQRLGLSAQNNFDVDSTRAADLGLWFSTAAGTQGLTIADIAAEGAITGVGFQENDRIISINGTPVNNESAFMRALLSPAGLNQPASVVVSRNGQQQTLTLQPAALVQGMAAADPYLQYGLILDTSNPNRVTVERVFPRTPAFYAGLRAGDVITGANGQPLTSAEAFTQALQSANGQIALQISRNNQTRTINFSLANQARTALRPTLDAGTGTTFQGTNTALPGAAASTTTTPPGPTGTPTT
jgi:S1-C subfamily serine protease